MDRGEGREYPKQCENMKERLILIGGGGHCRSCIDVIESQDLYEIGGIVDLPHNIGNEILGYKIIASDEDLLRLVKEYKNFLITIGQIKTPSLRRDKFALLKQLGGLFPNIISSKAIVSTHAVLGEGNIVMHNAIINAGAKIGNNCIINTGAIVEHDVQIGDHIHISIGAIVNGGTKIGNGTFVGSNSVLRECVSVGNDVIVGAGVTVMRDVSDGKLLKIK